MPTLIRRIVNETGCKTIGMLNNGSLRYEWQGLAPRVGADLIPCLLSERMRTSMTWTM
jgi:hypothetical protein